MGAPALGCDNLVDWGAVKSSAPSTSSFFFFVFSMDEITLNFACTGSNGKVVVWGYSLFGLPFANGARYSGVVSLLFFPFSGV